MTGDLAKRTVSGALLGFLGLGAVAAGGLWLTVAAALAAAVMGFEWRRLLHPGEDGWQGAGFALGCASVPFAVAAFGAVSLVPAAALAALLGFADGSAGQARAAPLLLAGAVVAGGAPAALVDLRSTAGAGFGIALWVCAAVVATDVVAYLGGRILGGRKLAPRISPGKTWSGAWSGLLAGAAVGMAAHALLFPEASRISGAAASMVIAAVAMLGDLGESALKRRADVKDSGRLIPGHGGALDRFDSLAPALLAVWAAHPTHAWLFGAEAS